MAFNNLGRGPGFDAEQALEREAQDANANFDPGRGHVDRRDNPNIQGRQINALEGRDTNAEQDARDEEDQRQRQEENAEAMKVYERLTPEEVFVKFDTDGSGYIDFEEYTAMLPQLGINITEAKARKYFALADTDGSGEIDFEEFKVAMFAVDPNTGNVSGFQPNSLLTPLDAFEMFDEDGSGKIDEDEFFFVLQYLGLKISDQKQDRMFAKFDTDGSGTLEYDEFRSIWLKCCNVKKELDDRGIEYPKFTSRANLEHILEEALIEEESNEAKALAEARQFKEHQALLKEKRVMLNAAYRRAKVELRNALDMCGQVYTFGCGTFGQFEYDVKKNVSTRNGPFYGFEEVYDIWYGRLHPDDSFLVKIGAEERQKVTADPNEAEEKLVVGQNLDVDDPRTEVVTSFFKDVRCPSNTAALWGRRIVQIDICENVAMALSDLGEVFAWGGTSHWWHEIEEDAKWQTEWRGDLTPRSNTLLCAATPGGGDLALDGGDPEATEVDEEALVDPDDALADKFKVVLVYFGHWLPPPLPSERLKYYKDVLFPKVPYEHLKCALEVRGQRSDEMTKLDILQLLYKDIILEKRILGERAHKRIRELEEEILDLRKRKKKFMAKKLSMDCQDLWEPLLHMQAEEEAEKAAEARRKVELKHIEAQRSYMKYRDNILEARLDGGGQYTERGNSLALQLSGITPRGPAMHTPRAFQKSVAITCGANHAALVHQNGQLYTWGFGGSGRLGHDVTLASGDATTADGRSNALHPTLVQPLAGRPVVRASCGYNHSGVVTADGCVYMWGSAATGKLGLGPITDSEECYCSVPTPIVVGEYKRVKRVSCGSSHTACITGDGQLFVWGCGDGGRLGLGSGRLGTVFSPTLVDLRDSKGAPARAGTVSCGNSHTLVGTVIREGYVGEGSSKVKVTLGGELLMAGPLNVLGQFCPSFTVNKHFADRPIHHIAAGFNHSAVVSLTGELFAWGNNYTGCCGAPLTQKFCSEPVNLKCLYQKAENLALGRYACQSTVYNGLDAYLAVDGNVEGDNPDFCVSSQAEAQPWWEVDLGDFCIIHSIKLWNRDDEPHDPAFDRDMFRSRLFPCYVMTSADPFPKEKKKSPLELLEVDDDESIEEAGDAVGNKSNLELALDRCNARIKLTKMQRCTTWHVPKNTMARYVRVQLHGFDFLHFAQLQVFGTPGINKPVGRCGGVAVGKNVTMALVRPASDPKDVAKAYKRAVKVDAHNADILRQFETFQLLYDTYGRGDGVKRCLVCKGSQVCDVCAVKARFEEELKNMPLGVGGMLPTLTQIGEFLMNAPKPELDWKPPERKKRTMFGDMFGPGGGDEKKEGKERGRREEGETEGDTEAAEQQQVQAGQRPETEDAGGSLMGDVGNGGGGTARDAEATTETAAGSARGQKEKESNGKAKEGKKAKKSRFGGLFSRSKKGSAPVRPEAAAE